MGLFLRAIRTVDYAKKSLSRPQSAFSVSLSRGAAANSNDKVKT